MTAQQFNPFAVWESPVFALGEKVRVVGTDEVLQVCGFMTFHPPLLAYVCIDTAHDRNTMRSYSRSDLVRVN